MIDLLLAGSDIEIGEAASGSVVRPLALISHNPSAIACELMKSNQFLTLTIPAFRSIGVT